MIELRGQRILVTGGAGLIGSHIVDRLVAQGARVVVYDSFVRGRKEHLLWAQEHGEVEIVNADLRDAAALADTMKGVGFVFHQAAAWLRACQEAPRLSVDVNIIGTFNLLEVCARQKVRKLVAASSSSVYGEGTHLPTDEEHPFNNDLFYGASKVTNEQHYRCFHKKYGLDYVGLRYLNVYGPRQPYQAAYLDAIMHFLNRIDSDLPPIVRGDGSATVDLVYADDAARANIMALQSDVTDVCLNVASGTETTVRRLAELLIELSGKQGRLTPAFEPMDTGLVTRRWGCPKKALSLLGFKTEVPVEEGLRRVIEWRQSVAAAGSG